MEGSKGVETSEKLSPEPTKEGIVSPTNQPTKNSVSQSNLGNIENRVNGKQVPNEVLALPTVHPTLTVEKEKNESFNQTLDEPAKQQPAILNEQAIANNNDNSELIELPPLQQATGQNENNSNVQNNEMGQTIEQSHEQFIKLTGLFYSLSKSIGRNDIAGLKTQEVLAEYYQSENLLQACLNDNRNFPETLRILSQFASEIDRIYLEEALPIRDYLYTFVGKHVDQIADGLQIDELKMPAFKLLYRALSHSHNTLKPNDILQKSISLALSSEIDIIAQICNEELQSNLNGSPSLKFLLRSGDSQLALKLFEAVRNKTLQIDPFQEDRGNDEDPIDQDISTISELLEIINDDVFGMGAGNNEFLLDHFLQQFGLEGQNMLQAWKMSGLKGTDIKYFDGKLSLFTIAHNNLTAIKELEQARPGSARILTKQFGIKDFARYPANMLVKQCEEVSDTQKPFGIVIYPRSDYNGAFYQERNVFDKVLPEQLTDEYAVRFAECSNKLELVRTLNKLRHTYGLISFAIIGGHGTPTSIQFGDSGSDKITKQDIQREGTSAITLAFKESAPILLFSCSTGQNGGIAQEISFVLNTEVTAPDQPTSPAQASIVPDEKGNLQFQAVFHKSVPSMTYSQGELSQKTS